MFSNFVYGSSEHITFTEILENFKTNVYKTYQENVDRQYQEGCEKI